jgi:hypothetical protein
VVCRACSILLMPQPTPPRQPLQQWPGASTHDRHCVCGPCPVNCGTVSLPCDQGVARVTGQYMCNEGRGVCLCVKVWCQQQGVQCEVMSCRHLSLVPLVCPHCKGPVREAECVCVGVCPAILLPCCVCNFGTAVCLPLWLLGALVLFGVRVCHS